MKKKLGFLAALLCLLALGVTLIACPTDSGDDGDGDGDGNGNGNGSETGATATISLAATDTPNQFTLTLTGATWKDVAIDNFGSESSMIGSSGAALLNWDDDYTRFSKTWSCVKTSESVLTITVEKTIPGPGVSGTFTGTGTLTLKGNDYWAAIREGGTTNGAHILNVWTNEGAQDDDYNYIGTLTVAEGSGSVNINIE
jgi:hypothetical protein